MTEAQIENLMDELRAIRVALEKLANPLIVVKPAEVTIEQIGPNLTVERLGAAPS